MATESATYIDDFTPTTPAATGVITEIDDELRQIKSVLQNTFPNVAGAVTATHTQLSYVTGVTSAIQTQIDAKLTKTLADGSVFVGNGSNVATAVAVTGDVTITNAGVTAIASGVIVNADVKSDAAIDATKIHDGSVDNTEFGYLNGVTSAIQTQLTARLIVPSTWNEVSGTTAATAGQGYYNSGASNYTVNLPGTPAAGNTVWLVTGGTGDLTIGRNGSNINAKAGDITLDTPGGCAIAAYSGDATVGWVVWKY